MMVISDSDEMLEYIANRKYVEDRRITGKF
ncbi:hypothetical protein SAMN05421825_3201 [Epilithonimonas hungarica]|jgi:hypothetical protein|uniref:Uncharacterized protein n=1 Tax=Epilithonimonas hungarica TaxID=454006 RepID=A0A1G7TRW0_9FLAO|nr:hypothetical protein SAMN05421825_3201 [Epilithonimonas hungarica]